MASYGLGQLTLLGQLLWRDGKAGSGGTRDFITQLWISFQGKLLEKVSHHLSKKGARSTCRNVNDSCGAVLVSSQKNKGETSKLGQRVAESLF